VDLSESGEYAQTSVVEINGKSFEVTVASVQEKELLQLKEIARRE